MTKRALITGVTGQDGAYLASYLLEKNYEVYGTYRRLSTPNFWRLQHLKVFEKINLIPIDLIDMGSIMEAIQIANPDEIYNLAAQSFVEASFEQPVATANVSGVSVTRFLETIRHLKPDAKFYQASSSEMFGLVGNGARPLTENAVFQPISPYAASKLYAHWLTKIYRDAYGLFACNGLLFNHESPLRGLEFVTRKISNAVAKIKLGIEKEIHLGNLDARRDWGYAPEYVDVMWRIIQQEKADDYVAGTGLAHSVREFAKKAFDVVGLNWEDYVRTDKRYFRPLDIECLISDPSKARDRLGWKSQTSFDRLVEIMVKEDLDRWRRWMAGEKFPWDAPNYPSEARILTRALRV
jgi:GDPmannose 4,6-dehydratase